MSQFINKQVLLELYSVYTKRIFLIIQNIQVQLKEPKKAFITIGLLGILVISSLSLSNTESQEIDNQPLELDTITPKGFSLLPVELANQASISSVIGDYGVVDLYSTQQFGQKPGRKVASRLKIFRSPRDPNQFSVMVPENSVQNIMQVPGPYIALVLNRDVKGSSVENTNSTRKIIVDYK